MADVTIIGAGITGLSCAWTLKKLGIDAVVLESSHRVGGVIRTEKVDGYLVECGPNSIQAAASVLELVNDVGLWDDLLPPNPNTSRFIYWDGKLRKFPFGPLSYSGIFRALREPLIRSQSRADESVRDFFTRRLGAEVHDRLVGPALTGIYAANTANLSMAAVFPRIVEMETKHGSLLRAFLKSLRGKRRNEALASSLPKPKGSMFSFPHGLDTLPKRLAERVDVKYNTRASGSGLGGASKSSIGRSPHEDRIRAHGHRDGFFARLQFERALAWFRISGREESRAASTRSVIQLRVVFGSSAKRPGITHVLYWRHVRAGSDPVDR
jgi:protoporphyrinogen oxidase